MDDIVKRSIRRLRRKGWSLADIASPAPDPYVCLRQDVRSEYAAFLARRDAQDAENRREHQERTGQRRYEPEEVENAAVRPPVMQDGVPFSLPRLTLTRRKHRAKGK